MLQFGENKAYVHNEAISEQLRHAQDTRPNFCFGCYHLNFMKKLSAIKNYAFVLVKNEMNIFLLILLSRN